MSPPRTCPARRRLLSPTMTLQGWSRTTGSVMEAGAFAVVRVGGVARTRRLHEMLRHSLQVCEEHGGEIAAEAVSDHDAEDRDVRHGVRHRVGGHEPAVAAEGVRYVIDRPGCAGGGLEGEHGEL